MGEGGALRGRHDGVSELVRAAVMDGGERPVYGEFAEPQAEDGALVVTMRAAALSGLDRNIARRLHYLKMPDGPFVVGREGVARTSDGRRIYFNVNAARPPFGSMAERTLIDPKFSFAVPDGVADDVAAALGNAGLAAWLALSWRARLRRGEIVLILGATGVSGLIAVTAARQLGAGRVIAAGRNREALARAKRLGADATVELAPSGDLVAAYRDAAGGEVDVVIDFLFGAPGEAALEVLALHGRFLHIGSMAGQSIALRGGPIRRTSADVMGFAYYHAPMELQAQAYAEMCRLAATGEIALDLKTRPLEEIAAAWDARAAGDRRRQVLVP
jgi:NADPH:quinone reductase-like Zn-dependent oxidoreductase